jgi:uncharacterized protein (DUF362 family)
MSRRRFLGNACRLGAGVLAGGGGLPDRPVAVAQSSQPLMYPPIGDPLDYDRENNICYPLVEEALMLLNPDNLENPLSNLVRPGDDVVIKPNWCTQYIFPLPITHPSLIHAVAEMAARAGAARVRIVEAPMTMSHAATWFYGRTFINMPAWLDHLNRKHPGTVFEHQDGNADEFTWVRLGDRSLLAEHPIDALRHDTGYVEKDIFYYVPDSRGYDPNGYEHGIYAIANSYLEGDVFINFPKMKTHAWTGITIALKNLMGLNLMSTVYRMPPERAKEYLSATQDPSRRENGMRDVPHFDGRYADIYNLAESAPDNDVLWRSLSDLNRIIHFCDREGRLQETRQRRYLNIVDGIIGTEGDGPITGYRVNSHTVIAGTDPVRVDAVASRVMGYDPRRIPLVRNAAELPSGYIFGRMDGYEESVVTSAGDGEMPQVHPYEQPAIWAANEKANMSLRRA